MYSSTSSAIVHDVGSWLGAYKLAPLSTLTGAQAGERSCWTALFSSAVVADDNGRTSRDWGSGLELSFDLMIQLAGVENYCWLGSRNEDGQNKDGQNEDGQNEDRRNEDGGYIAIGFFSALVPISRHGDSVQWHLEGSEGELLSLSEISSKHVTRLMKTSPGELSKLRCFLGWCENADILLGTSSLPPTLSWSGLRQRDTSLKPAGYSFTAQLGGNIGPLQAVVQGTQLWLSENVCQVFDRDASYAKAIQKASRQVALVFDTTTRRVWLVPKLSLMLHLCHCYFAYHSKDDEHDLIPFAQPSTDGAMAAKHVLSGQGDIQVFQHGIERDDQIRLRNILVDISNKMARSLSRGVCPRSLRALGPELMDLIAEPGRGALLTEVSSTDFPSAAPTAFITLVDSVYVCSDLGPAIRATGIPGSITCSCVTLDENKGYLAAHVKCLESILLKKHRSLHSLQQSPLEINNQTWWTFKPFTPCNHLANASFWAVPDRFMQRISCDKGQNLTRNPCAARVPAVTGAVVFGGADNIWDRLWKIMRS